MKQIIKVSVYLLVLSVLFQSCLTSKPVAGSASSPDYNKRVNVSYPGYKKKSNAIDVVFNVGLIGAGAYGGYNMNLIQQQTANGKEPVRAANAAIGALAGASIAYLIDQISGKGNIYRATDPNKWIRKANNNYKFLKGSNDNFTIIHSAAEMNYTIRNINDVRDFKTAFPNSLQTDMVFKQGINNLSRNELPELIEMFPNNQYAEAAKIKYIESSANFEDVVAAIKKYPVNYDAEPLLLGKIENPKQSIQFIGMYPQSNNKRKALISAFSNRIPSVNEITDLKDAYSNEFSLNASDFSGFSGKVKKNYYLGLFGYAGPQTFSAFDRFNNDFQWLQYDGKGNDVAGAFWDFCDKQYSEGNDVIWKFLTLSIDPLYKQMGVDDKLLDAVMTAKLSEITKKQVFVSNIQNTTADNPNFERWKSSSTLTAGLVEERGELIYYLFGKVSNDSKYDLPLVLDGKASLIQTTSVKGTGNFTNFISKLLNDATSNNKTYKGDAENKFFFPNLPSRTTTIFVIHLDFGEGIKRQGVNIMDWYKFVTESRLEGITVTPAFSSSKPSYTQLRIQDDWVTILHKGIEDAKLVDTWRGEEMRQEIWDAEYSRRQAEAAERARRWAEEEKEKEKYRAIGEGMEREYLRHNY